MGKKYPVKTKRYILLLFLLIFTIIFIGIRIVNLHEVVNFGPDQGRDFMEARQIYLTKQLTLIGPPSEYTIDGRQFFFGPAPYYIILPALVISNWDPLAVSYFLIAINTIALFVSSFFLYKYTHDKITVISFIVFCTFFPHFVTESQSYWNSHFMLPLSILLIPLLSISKSIQSRLPLYFSLVGFIFGLGLQFHYSFIFTIVLALIWLVKNKKITVHTTLLILCGFLLGFSPLIIFELRNNFYNTQTFLKVITSSKASSEFTFHSFYFISVIPFLFLFMSILLAKMRKFNNIFMLLFLIIFACWSTFYLATQKKPELTFSELEKISQIILSDSPNDFNIVDQMTGDNRALALRFLLTRSNEPMNETAYPNATTLYVYSNKPVNELLKNPIWEIASANTTKVSQTWTVDNNLSLYKLVR